jgi:hypothetical protein
VVTDANIEKVEELLKEERRLLLLPFSLGISMEQSHHTITDCLRMRIIFAKPHAIFWLFQP